MLAPELRHQVAAIAKSAGAAILPFFDQQPLDIRQKADGSPVTIADLTAHQVIVDGLQQLQPVLPILSEEAADIPFSVRRHWRRYWLVDPLDGTKEFSRASAQFTVNIALIEDGAPRLGVVYVPVTDRLYCGEVGVGAWCNERPIQARPTRGEQDVVLGSRSHASAKLDDWLQQLPQDYELQAVGSSLKFCLIAEGKADIYPRFSPTCEWDTAAGQAVAEAAGARVLTTDGRPLRYNQHDSLINDHFIVDIDD